MDILSKLHKQFLLDLLECEIDYILVGGYAVNYHGYARLTVDMDIWLKPDNENKEKFIHFLKSYDIEDEGISIISNFDFTKAHSFHLGENEEKIDFLTKISGVSWEECEPHVSMLTLADKSVKVIQYKHLIINKIVSDRPQDRADVAILQKINKYRNPPFET